MGKILQLSPSDKERLWNDDDLQYLYYEGAPTEDLHNGNIIPVNLNDVILEAPFETHIFNEYITDMRYAMIGILGRKENLWLTVKMLLGISLEPMQVVQLQELWEKPYPLLIATRGGGKSFLLAIYIMLRCIFTPGCRVAVVGFGLRQARNLYNYVEKLWKNAPLLQEMLKEYPQNQKGPLQRVDRYVFIFGNSIASFLPLGSSGATIRGERAEYIIIDEYGDVPKVIVDTVVAGFAAVSGDPIKKRQLLAKIKRLKAQGRWDNNKEHELRGILKSNQIILSGTAKFHFNHFAQDWLRYKEIIKANNDKEALSKITGEEDHEKLPNSDDYSIIRIPYDIIPDGIMDKNTIHRTKGSTSKAVYEQEYGAVFTDDSDGFFKAKLLYLCTANDEIHYMGKKICEPFDPRLRGKPGKKYILGFDPAAEQDNAAIVILELYDGYAKVVYCWTLNKKIYEKEIMKDVGSLAYNKYLAVKIAQLHKAFNFEVMSFDALGGGDAVAEILGREPDARPEGMPPLLPITDGHILWDGKERVTDDVDGQHIIELVQFGNKAWNTEAHYGLRTDLEQRRLLFPRFDALSINVDDDDMSDNELAEISNEIEQIKYELTILEHTKTDGGNRERWDTPEVKHDNDKKGRLRNDRASALLLANMAARRIRLAFPEVDYFTVSAPKKEQGDWKHAPHWFKQSKATVGVFSIIGDD